MKTNQTYNSAMNYRSAALFALAISLTMHVLSSIMFFYRR